MGLVIMIQDLLNTYNQYRAAVAREELLPPMMVFAGEESFFVNLFEELLTHQYIPKEEETINRTILYGPEIVAETILSEAQTYSMFGGKRIIIVREATQVKASSLGKGKNLTIEELPSYAASFAEGTSVALFYRGKDAGAKMRKAIEKGKAILVESPQIRKDVELKHAYKAIAQRYGLKLSPQVVSLLMDLIGNDLTTLDSQLSKLVVPASQQNGEVSTEMVTDMVGMSREYNPFELINAIKEHNFLKSMQMATYMAENEKRYPFPMIVSMLYNFFSNLLVYHFNKKMHPTELCKLLNLRNEYLLKDYQKAASFYGGVKTMNILTDLRKADANYKGVNGTSLSPEAIFKELIIDIFF